MLPRVTGFARSMESTAGMFLCCEMPGHRFMSNRKSCGLNSKTQISNVNLSEINEGFCGLKTPDVDRFLSGCEAQTALFVSVSVSA